MNKIVSNDLFFFDRLDNVIKIKFFKQFRNKQWGIYFGYIQKLLDNEKEIEHITFDFSRCQWMDPLPLLSFIVSVRTFTENNKQSRVSIKVSNEDTSSKSVTKKLLKFLAIEGFLKEFLKITRDVYNDSYIIDEAKIESLNHLDIQLQYNNCSILPCAVINLDEVKTSEVKLENELFEFTNKVKISLLGKDRENVIDEIIYKVKIILDETLQNIKYHAYVRNTNLFAAFYIRYRYGLTNKAIGSEGKSNLEIAIAEEEINCPKLDKAFIESHYYFIEVFIVDSGVGIKETLNPEANNFAFRDEINEVMVHGKRSKKRENENLTEKGGLSLIYTLLSADKDYLCGLSNGQWIGEFVPFTNRQSTYISAATNQIVSKSLYPDVKGLSWIFRLSINSNKILDSEKWLSIANLENKYEVFEDSYSSIPQNEESVLSTIIRDYRFDPNSTFALQLGNLRNEYKVNPNEKYLLVFPMKGLTKTGIWHLLEKALSEIKILPAISERTLIIADIPNDQAIVYLASLANVRILYNNSWKAKVSQIILITRTLNVCFLRKSFTPTNQIFKNSEVLFTFEINYKLGQDFINSKLNDIKEFNPSKSIVDLIKFIRFYDSQIFWNYLFEQKNNRRYFLNNKNILWTEELKKIDGYLNFSETLHDPLLNEIYRISLERCKCLYEGNFCSFEYLDDLTKTIVQRTPSNQSYKLSSKSPSISVGSVYVTNDDPKLAMIKRKKLEGNILIHFFVHKDSPFKNNILSLLYWPDDEVIQRKFKKSDEQYQRIGKTFTIAKYGSKYFTIPRYLKNNEKCFPFYIRSPRDTYKDWQSILIPIVTFGNYSYEGLNDLITVDIKKAVEHSFKYQTELSKFLIADFIYALLGPKVKRNVEAYISDEYPEYRKFMTELVVKDIRRTEFYEEAVELIVYPDHSDTGIIVEYIKRIIIDVNLKSKIIPLKFIKSNNAANSLLISPLTIEHMEDLLKKKSNERQTVLIFDSVLVSGKTRKQIKHTLFGLGVKVIKTLVVLDRSRLPISLPSEKSFRAYWRFDVPTFGIKGPNIITRTLNEIISIKENLVESVGKRIEEWTVAWGETQIYLRRYLNGLDATSINNEGTHHLKKYKYGIEKHPPHKQLGGDENCIEITNSHGLIVYLCEMRIMTGRDDLLLKFLNRSDLSDTIKIEIICTQLLLFPEEFPNETLYKIVETLFLLTYKRSDHDHHTSLSALTLCAQRKGIIEKLFEQIKSQRVERIYKVNLDIQITLAFLSIKYKLKTLEFSHYNQLLIKRKDDSLLTIYKRIHFDIYQDKGKLHSKPLLTLIDNSPYDIKDKLRQALNCIFRLTNIFNSEVRSEYFDTGANINMNKLLDELSFSRQLCEQLLLNKIEPMSDNLMFNKLLFRVKNFLIPQIMNVHDSVFTLVNGTIRGDRPLEKKVRKIINDITTNKSFIDKWKEDALNKGIKRSLENMVPKISFSNVISDFPESYRNFERIFIPYDHYVVLEIKDILFNSLCANSFINNPWNFEIEQSAEMWVHIIYEDDCVKIVFANSINGDEYESIANKISSKIKLERDHLVKKLNCKFKPEFKKINNIAIIEVSLSLPIIF